MNQTVNRQKPLTKGFLELEKPQQRTYVIGRLNRICAQLETWARQKKPVLPLRVQLYRAAIHGYSTLLSGLKDEELEQRVKELEETIKDGVVIPGEQKSKR